jgi:hypothetical protein
MMWHIAAYSYRVCLLTINQGVVMDVTQIAALATSMTQTKDADDLNIAMAKKAIDAQKTIAAGLIAAIPPAPVTSSMGHTINTQA